LPTGLASVTDRECPAYRAKAIFGELIADEATKSTFDLLKNSETKKRRSAKKW